MPNYLRGHKLLGPLCEALGIRMPVQKLVLEVDVKGVVTVYVKGLAGDDTAGAVAGAVQVVLAKELTVGADGTVLAE